MKNPYTLIILIIAILGVTVLAVEEDFENQYQKVMTQSRMRMLEIKRKVSSNTNVNSPEMQERLIVLDSENTFEYQGKNNNNMEIPQNFAQIQSEEGDQEACNAECLRIPVFDRQADIGELYDARTDFLHIGERLWPADPKQSMAKVVKQAMPRAQYDFYMENNLADKLNGLDASLEFSVSMYAGLIEVSGRGAFINKKKDSNKVQRGVLTYDNRSFGEKIQDFSPILYLDDQFARSDVTHVVSGLEWGTMARVIVDYKMDDSENLMQIGGYLSISITFAMATIKGTASLELTNSEKKLQDRFKITTIADVVITGSLPTDLEGAIEFMKSIPDESVKNNEGKGKVQFMTLTPLCLVKKNVSKINTQLNAIYSTLKANIALQLEKEFKELEETMLQISSLQNDYDEAPKLMIDQERYNTFENWAVEFERFKNDKTDLIKDILLNYRSGRPNEAEETVKVLNDHKLDSAYNIPKTQRFIKEEKELLQKQIAITEELAKKKFGINTVKVVEKSLSREIGNVERKKVVLYYTVDKVLKPDDNYRFFFQLMEFYKPLNTDYFIILVDIIELYKDMEQKSFIEYYETEGRFKRQLRKVTDDYLNYKDHEVAVHINDKTEIDDTKQLFYVGIVDKNEQRQVKGQLYTDAKRAEKALLKADYSEAKMFLLYEGGWKDDKFNGKGTLYHNGGDIKCEGSFLGGNSNGYLKCKDDLGNYEGQLNEYGQRDGKGNSIFDPIDKPNDKCQNLWEKDVKTKQIQCWNDQSLKVSNFSIKFVPASQNTDTTTEMEDEMMEDEMMEDEMMEDDMMEDEMMEEKGDKEQKKTPELEEVQLRSKKLSDKASHLRKNY